MQRIRDGLHAIGREMVACDAGCAAASCSPQTPPRCLYLQESERPSVGIVVVGLNPGRANDEERAYYLSQALSYELTQRYLHDHIASINFYKRLEPLVRSLGFSGPILWTELAKCELNPLYKYVPLSMQRTCAGRFLQRELELVDDWPVMAVGRNAFMATSMMCLHRAVIGVPHPTGSRSGAYRDVAGSQWCNPDERTIQVVKDAVRQRAAVWLGQSAV